ETTCLEGVYVNGCVLLQHKLADQARGCGSLGETEMAVPESIEDMGRVPRTIDNRQGIRQRRAIAHPLPPTFRLQAGQERRSLGEHRRGTRIVGSPPQT